jgi:nucleoside-diphosphate-sugar epimerase
MKRALVTGASGFVGRFTVAALKQRGYEVHGVARRPASGIEVDRWHDADLLAKSGPGRIVREVAPSHLLHLAWTTEHGSYWEDPANQAWVAATGRLVDAFVDIGGERFVLGGTCAQYDWNSKETMSETRTARHPSTLYGRAKQETEETLAEAQLSATTALLFFPYGPYEKPERLIPSVARSLLAGDEARTSAGEQVRDFLHVADCGGALAAIVDSELTGSINVGSGQGTSVAAVAARVAQIVGRGDLLRLGDLAGDDETSVVADIGRLRNELGFRPQYQLDDGLRDAVDWWRQRTRRR